jgi:hypothetical protein
MESRNSPEHHSYRLRAASPGIPPASAEASPLEFLPFGKTRRVRNWIPKASLQILSYIKATIISIDYAFLIRLFLHPCFIFIIIDYYLLAAFTASCRDARHCKNPFIFQDDGIILKHELKSKFNLFWVPYKHIFTLNVTVGHFLIAKRTYHADSPPLPCCYPPCRLWPTSPLEFLLYGKNKGG